jgi:hypothetical protein
MIGLRTDHPVHDDRVLVSLADVRGFFFIPISFSHPGPATLIPIAWCSDAC